MIKKSAPETNQASNRILTGTTIEGEISSKGDVRVDGKVKGKINITGKLVIGEKGLVEGEIKCAYANISGSLKGQLEVSELLSLQATARVHGDIITNKLSIEPGAEFTGSCAMGSVLREIRKDEDAEEERGTKEKTQRREETA